MNKIALTLIVSLALVSGCKDSNKAENYPTGNLDFVAPGGVGGGWDTTIRAVKDALTRTKLVKANMPIRNHPGNGGAIHLAEMQQKKGSDDMIVVYSPPLILTKLAGNTDLNYKNTTPIANLIADYGVFVVKADSPYKTINELMDAIKANPKAVKIGGNSSPGSMDHLQFLLFAKAAGVADLKEIPYVAFDDSGAAQILGGHIDLFSTSLADVRELIKNGNLRALCQTAEKTKSDVTSCKDQGINSTFVNWRGIFGTPEMPDYAAKYWEETFDKLVKTPEWQVELNKYGWDDYYIPRDKYTEFLDKRNEEFETILNDIGMLHKQ